MLFYSRFAERPYCAWADLQAIFRNGIDMFRMDTVGETLYDFQHASNKEAAVVAMDRLRMQQLLGATDDRVLHYEHRHETATDEVICDIVFFKMILETELEMSADDEAERQVIVREQQYLNFLEWNIHWGAGTDPYQERRKLVDEMQPRWLALAMGTGLCRDLILKVLPPPKLEDVFDAD